MLNRTKYTKFMSRGVQVIMPEQDYLDLREDNYHMSVVFNKKKQPSTVQINRCENGKTIYCGNLKATLGVKSFKNGNVCDFRKSNVILEEKEI